MNPPADAPSRVLVYAELSSKVSRRNWGSGIEDQRDSGKPLWQRQMSTVKDRADRDAKRSVAIVAATATLFGRCSHPLRITVGTNRLAVPADSFQKVETIIIWKKVHTAREYNRTTNRCSLP